MASEASNDEYLESEDKYPKWIYKKDLVENIGYVEQVVKRGGVIQSTVKIDTDQLPLRKDTAIAIVPWPLCLKSTPEKWQIYAIGIVVKGLMKTTEIKITHSFDEKYKIGEKIKVGNAELAFICSRIKLNLIF